MKLLNEQKDDKGCSTCAHLKRVHQYPGFVTAEECECDAGLKCDTVFFTVNNCPKWVWLFEETAETEKKEN